MGSGVFKEGAGAGARFKNSEGVAVDAAGTVFVADVENNRIRRISAAGEVVTLAGDGTQGYKDGSGPMAQFNGPAGVAVGAHGNVFVAEIINNRIRQITPTGLVITIAGDGVRRQQRRF